MGPLKTMKGGYHSLKLEATRKFDLAGVPEERNTLKSHRSDNHS